MGAPRSGGGFPAIWYTWQKARQVGPWKLWKAMRTPNACKTCALGMGGQAGGMVNERGGFPEVCKKSLQAMVSDMQGAIQPEFWQRYSVAELQSFTPRELETCGRLVEPVLLQRGQTHYRPIGWSESFDRISAKLRATAPDETFWYTSGRSSNEAGFLTQLFARLYGTNHINNCSYYCHQASGVGLSSSVGTGTATIELADLEKTELVFLIGGNPASNHPRLMTSLAHVRGQGGGVIVINPVRETGLVNFRIPSMPRSLLFGTPIASLYVQPHIGGDLALLSAISKRIVALGAVDEAFVQSACEGWPALRAWLVALDGDALAAQSGVSQGEIDKIARRYAEARSAVFAWTMGITHHVHGVENVQAIANLALLRGMVGRPHAGLLPIRGHSNVQGIGTMGVTPRLREAVFERLQTQLGVKLPTTPGFDTLACMEGADQGRFHFAFCLGGNLYGANPDAAFTARALGRLEQIVYLNTTLNTGHAHGLAEETLILPVLARDEEPEPTTQESMFNYVRYSIGGSPRHIGPKSEVAIVTRLADAVLAERTPVDWRALGSHREIRHAIARAIPGCEALAEIDETRREFHLPGRVLHEGRFPTVDGKARFHVPTLAPEPLPADHLRLMTVRSEGQFNTVVYEDNDFYRGQDRRDVVLVHPEDLRRLGIKPDSRVVVRSTTGQWSGIVARPFADIRPGNCLMYYPEANVLVGRAADPHSRTPAFKNIPVTIVPVSAHEEVAASSASAQRVATVVGAPSRPLKAC